MHDVNRRIRNHVPQEVLGGKVRREDACGRAELFAHRLAPGFLREFTQFANRLHHLGRVPRLHPAAVHDEVLHQV